MHRIGSALVAGVLAAVCSQAMAAPISLPSLIDPPRQPRPVSTSGSPAQAGLMAVIEFPEMREAVFAEILQPRDRIVKENRAGSQPAQTRDRGVPEPPTALTFATALLMSGSFWVLHGKMRKQGHRPFRRRVRHVWRLMA